jgi:peptidoglycan hydrolase-like protein with peptidoglycan-binding domain
VDGIFGSATKSALQYAQGREGISKDGVYGEDSRTNLLWEFSRGGAHHCARL